MHSAAPGAHPVSELAPLVAPCPPAAPHVLVLYAFLVAAARFIPIPILDDLVPERLKQLMARTLLRRAGRRYPSRFIAPLWSDGGCLGGCLGSLLLLPIKLLSYPIRKVITVVRAVHGISRRMVQTFLLGRTLARALQHGLLPDSATSASLLAEAALLRRAFDRALRETNPSLLTAPLEGALRGMRGIGRAGARLARAAFRRGGLSVEVGGDAASGAEPDFVAVAAAAAPTEQRAVGAALDVFERLLERPDIKAFLADFDARVDAAYAEAPPR